MKKQQIEKWTNKNRDRGRLLAFLLCVLILAQLFLAPVDTKADPTEAAETIAPFTYQDLEEELPQENRISSFSLEADALAVEGEADGTVSENLPAAYRSDAVSENGVSANYLPNAMRDQGSYGVCWAFSALGACEASLIRKGLAPNAIDLSERHLSYYFYKKGAETADALGGTAGDYNELLYSSRNYLQAGGNNYLTIWHLASWCGPVYEELAPFAGIADKTTDEGGLMGQANSYEMAYGSDAFHLQNAYVIPMGSEEEETWLTQRWTVQKLIMEYGALAVSYYAQSTGADDNPVYDSYYNSSVSSTNHAVQVVGWDDDFPKEHFDTEAPGDGAWLIKNSWGDEEDGELAQYGYFWLSYYDASLRGAGKYAFVLDCESADNYDNIYQYDGNAWYRALGKVNGTKTTSYDIRRAANVFTAQANDGKDELLQAVGIGTRTQGDYSLTIYTNLTDAANPESGAPVWTQTGTIPYDGYHTVSMNEPVSLPAGTTYSVVFTFQGASYVYAARDRAYNPWNFISEEKEGESFFYRRSTEGWLDAANNAVTDPSTLRIKAYTDNTEERSGGNTGEEPGDNPSGGTENPPGGETGDTPGGETGETPGGETGDTPPSGENGQTGGTSTGGITVADLLGLTMSRAAVTIENGRTYSLSAEPIYSAENVTPWMVYWKSSNEAVASVNAYGEVTAKKPGKTTITVYNGSIQATCVVTVKPKKVTLSSVKLSGNRKAKLTWKKVEGASGYVIYRTTSLNGSYQKVKTISGGSKRTITLCALNGSKAYYYKVRAYKIIDGKKVYGSYSSTKTVAPKAVTVTSVKARSNKRVKLTWETLKAADGYVIYRSTSRTGTYKRVKTVTSNQTVTCTNTAPKKEKTYYYKVRAYKKINGKTVYGAYSESIAVKTK